LNTYRIGVIADTHVPEFSPGLPSQIEHHFQGVDMILHAGDITGLGVLEKLSSIAPVISVKGDHDTLDLPMKTTIDVGGKRIGLIHGRRSRWKELPSIIANALSGGRRFWWGGFQRQVVQLFDDVDAVVFGHFHRAYIAMYNNVLFFNPGAVYQLTPAKAQKELRTTRSLLRRIYLFRHAYLYNRKHDVPMLPTVGLLTIANGEIKAEVLPISE